MLTLKELIIIDTALSHVQTYATLGSMESGDTATALELVHREMRAATKGNFTLTPVTRNPPPMPAVKEYAVDLLAEQREPQTNAAAHISAYLDGHNDRVRRMMPKERLEFNDDIVYMVYSRAYRNEA